MSNDQQQLQKQLQRLQEENKQLQETCDGLQQAQANYEQIISENNVNYLRSDMARMELEQIFSAYTDAMWVVREDGIVLRANEAMLEILDKTSEEVIGQPCAALIEYNLCDSSKCPVKRVNDDQTYDFDIQINAAQGNGNYYLLTTAPLITLDGTPGIVAQFKDITNRKQAEEALELANQKLAKMALRDGLTQIANRRCFDETLQQEWVRLQREQQPLSLILSDIDFFKKYNDHYGHQQGDDCLAQVAQALEKMARRPADLVARYGGEEFAVILPNTDSAGALHMGDLLLQTVREQKIAHEKSEISSVVTLSLGAATLVPTPDSTPENLIKLADDALYQAKKSGRNRVVSA